MLNISEDLGNITDTYIFSISALILLILAAFLLFSLFRASVTSSKEDGASFTGGSAVATWTANYIGYNFLDI